MDMEKDLINYLLDDEEEKEKGDDTDSEEEDEEEEEEESETMWFHKIPLVRGILFYYFIFKNLWGPTWMISPSLTW